MPSNRINELDEESVQYRLNFNDVIDIVTRRWKFIGLFAIACAFTTAAITLLIPNKYTARSTILPTTNEYQSSSLMSLAEGIPGLDMMGLNLGGQSSSALYPEILKSRQLAEKVLTQKYSYSDGEKNITQDLYEYFDVDNADDAYQQLYKYTSVDYDKKTGVVGVSVTTKNAVLSAKVANYFIACLDYFNMNQRKTGAGMNRDFIENRIEEAEQELKHSEEALREFRESNLNYYSSTDPELLMEHDRLYREVQMQNQVYLTLKQQYEIATIQAKKELPIIQVLDHATPPALKSSPKRAKITIVGLFLGLMVSLLYAIVDYLYREKYRSDNIKEFITSLRLVNRTTQTEQSEYVH